MSDQGDRVSRLIEALRATVEDPIAPGAIEALWDVDFQAQLRAFDEHASEIEQSLDEVSNQNGAGVLGLEMRQVLERFRHAAFIVRADARIEAMNLLARRTIDVDPGQFVDDIGYERPLRNSGFTSFWRFGNLSARRQGRIYGPVFS
jgi:hypothetical protein